jgi:hypothetical protein
MKLHCGAALDARIAATVQSENPVHCHHLAGMQIAQNEQYKILSATSTREGVPAVGTPPGP